MKAVDPKPGWGVGNAWLQCQLVMSDMCWVVCEPAAPAARLTGALLSGRILNQAEPWPPGTRGDRPSTQPTSESEHDLVRRKRPPHQGDGGPSRPLLHLLKSFPWLSAGTWEDSRPRSSVLALLCVWSPRTQALCASSQAPVTWPSLPWQLSLPAQTSFPAGPTLFPKGDPGCQKEFNSKASVHSPSPHVKPGAHSVAQQRIKKCLCIQGRC